QPHMAAICAAASRIFCSQASRSDFCRAHCLAGSIFAACSRIFLHCSLFLSRLTAPSPSRQGPRRVARILMVWGPLGPVLSMVISMLLPSRFMVMVLLRSLHSLSTTASSAVSFSSLCLQLDSDFGLSRPAWLIRLSVHTVTVMPRAAGHALEHLRHRHVLSESRGSECERGESAGRRFHGVPPPGNLHWPRHPEEEDP